VSGEGESEKREKGREWTGYNYDSRVMKKKGAGARRAVCGVLRPRVFQTATDALGLVVRLRGRGKSTRGV
jgi:hypothetical protein